MKTTPIVLLITLAIATANAGKGDRKKRIAAAKAQAEKDAAAERSQTPGPNGNAVNRVVDYNTKSHVAAALGDPSMTRTRGVASRRHVRVVKLSERPHDNRLNRNAVTTSVSLSGEDKEKEQQQRSTERSDAK